MRVVSLLPSATESFLAIRGTGLPPGVSGSPLPRSSGGGGRGSARPEGVVLVGRSHECDHPPSPELSALPILTAPRIHFTTSKAIDESVKSALAKGESLYTLNTDLLRSLAPDLILTQDLCHVCSIDLDTVRAAIADLSPHPAILSLNPHTFEAVLDDILSIGRAVNLEREATNFVVTLRERTYRAEEYTNPYADAPSVAFLEWTDPLFTGGHWTPQLIERAGGQHPLNPTIPRLNTGAAAGPIGQTLRRAGPSIQITPESLVASKPDYLIICPCGLSLEQAWRETELLSKKEWWGHLPAVQRGKVAVVDGNHMFNRPGPRLVDALEFLVGYLNERPDIIPPNFPWRAFV
jgi:ABC-type Fe3+-hydroxamate transport system substrate-binding protein